MLIDSISYHPTETQNCQQENFSTKDLKNACSQIQLHNGTAKQGNFKIICGESTLTYTFKTGFYGLTHMPAESSGGNGLNTYRCPKYILFVR